MRRSALKLLLLQLGVHSVTALRLSVLHRGAPGILGAQLRKPTGTICMVNGRELAIATLGHYSRRAVQFWEVCASAARHNVADG